MRRFRRIAAEVAAKECCEHPKAAIRGHSAFERGKRPRQWTRVVSPATEVVACVPARVGVPIPKCLHQEPIPLTCTCVLQARLCSTWQCFLASTSCEQLMVSRAVGTLELCLLTTNGSTRGGDIYQYRAGSAAQDPLRLDDHAATSVAHCHCES